MPILLDKRPIQIAGFDEKMTVGQALEEAKRSLAGSGLMVFGVRCDHREIEPPQLDDVLRKPAGSFDEVEFVTGEPRGIALEAMKQARDALAETFAGVKRAAEAHSTGDLSEAMQIIMRCLGIWSQAHEAVVQGGTLAGLDFESVRVSDRPLLEWIQDLSRQLRNLKEAIESRDHVLLGDILHYELDDTLQGWDHMMGGIIDHLELRLARVFG